MAVYGLVTNGTCLGAWGLESVWINRTHVSPQPIPGYRRLVWYGTPNKSGPSVRWGLTLGVAWVLGRGCVDAVCRPRALGGV